MPLQSRIEALKEAMPDRQDHLIFAPFDALAKTLLPHALAGDDGAHDIGHLGRVFANAMRIQAIEGGDAELLAGACLLHDCVAVEKDSPLRAQASRLAADKARGILADLGWAADRIEACAHAILTHSFSAGIEPETLEAKILQDADRLDAIGMIGVARLFYVAGRMRSGLYDPADPLAESRPLDDRRFAVDHFPAKLFKLADGFRTGAGKALAAERDRRLHQFREMFFEEIGA